jgi:translation initiation factor IF-3
VARQGANQNRASPVRPEAGSASILAAGDGVAELCGWTARPAGPEGRGAPQRGGSAAARSRRFNKGDRGIPPPGDRRGFPDRGGEQKQRVNEQIRISPIRLIGANGEQLGVVPTSQALEMAREANLDLVEVAAQERPPVCKIMDYGKFRYQQSRKGTKTKTHQQKLKEIRVRPKTGEHDVDTKINQARKFLEHRDKVQLNVLFRGRELQHIEEGQRIILHMMEQLADVAKVEQAPRMEGKRMVCMLAPKG